MIGEFVYMFMSLTHCRYLWVPCKLVLHYIVVLIVLLCCSYLVLCVCRPNLWAAPVYLGWFRHVSWYPTVFAASTCQSFLYHITQWYISHNISITNIFSPMNNIGNIVVPLISQVLFTVSSLIKGSFFATVSLLNICSGIMVWVSENHLETICIVINASEIK